MIYDDEVLTDTPTRYLKGEETSGTTWTDASGNGGDGAYAVSGVTLGKPGPLVDAVSYAPLFNGSTGRASLTLTGDDRPSYPWTLECWVRPSSATPTAVSVAVAMRASDDNEYASIFVGTGNRWAGTVINATLPTVAAVQGSVAITGGMQHLALVAAAPGNYTLYVDGVSAGQDLVNAPAWTGTVTSYALSAGSNAISMNFLAGAVGRVALYPSALSAARIAAHYRAGVLSPVYQAVSEALKADATVLAATSGRIFADQFPDDGAMPGVRYVLLTDTPHNRLGSGESFTGELQVDAYAAIGEENRAHLIADAARLALERRALKTTGFSQIKTLTTQRPLPMREAALSRVHSRYRLFGSAA